MPYSLEEGRYIHEFEELPSFPVEKNLITCATARTGKGVTQIIPWLLANTKTNALVIDPKGEALEASLKKRSSVRSVYALDPFNTTKNTEAAKATLNVLDFIDPNSNSAFREINALADGLVMRHDAKSAHWDGGGVEILAGFIAHVLTHEDFEGNRSLVTVRQMLTLPVEEFNLFVDDMAKNSACGNLAGVAATKINNSGNEANHFISTAMSNTKWLDDPDIAECLGSSSFNLREIKTKNIDVFLVLPVEALGDYGRFLRLFVRMALYYMQVKVGNSELKGKEVFFILDEAFSLGHISEIESSMSSMPGFNLRMWTFWQDVNQIVKRYDAKGAGTFFANSDAAYFFGVNDPETAQYVSKAAGTIVEYEIGIKPPAMPKKEIPMDKGFWEPKTAYEDLYHKAIHRPENFGEGGIANWLTQNAQRTHENARAALDRLDQNDQAQYQDEMNEYHHARNVIGRPRITADEVQQITKRNPKRNIADHALVLREGVCYIQPLKAFFEGKKSKKEKLQAKPGIELTPKPRPKNRDQKLREKGIFRTRNQVSAWRSWKIEIAANKWNSMQKKPLALAGDRISFNHDYYRICPACLSDVYLISVWYKNTNDEWKKRQQEIEYCDRAKEFKLMGTPPFVGHPRKHLAENKLINIWKIFIYLLIIVGLPFAVYTIFFYDPWGELGETLFQQWMNNENH